MSARFEDHMAMIMKNTIVWDMIPCSLAQIYRLSEKKHTASIFRVEE
jgi:hypothetical protein